MADRSFNLIKPEGSEVKVENFPGKWCACALGAVNGLIYSVVVMQVTRLYNDYLHRLSVENAEKFNMTPPLVIYDSVNWSVIVCWFILLFTVASYFGHRYWAERLKSPLLLWIANGIAAVVGWNLIQLTVAWLEMATTGQDFLYKEVTSPANTLSGPISLALVIGVNLIYSTVIQLSSALYTRSRLRL